MRRRVWASDQDRLIPGNALLTEVRTFLVSSTPNRVQTARTPSHRTQTSVPESVSDVPNVPRVPDPAPEERRAPKRSLRRPAKPGRKEQIESQSNQSDSRS